MDVRRESLQVAAAELGKGMVLISVNDAYVPGDPVTIDDCERWDTSGPLLLAHLGGTEGEITPNVEVAFTDLTFPEHTGPAPHKRYYDGESVTLTVPLFFALERHRAICSPTGIASGGYDEQRRTREHTLVVVPQQLLFDEATDSFLPLTWDGVNGFQVGGQALTSTQTRLLGLSMWFWRGSWGRQLPSWRHDEGGKVVQPVEFTVMHAEEMPDGHHLYTLGDPTLAGISLEGGS